MHGIKYKIAAFIASVAALGVGLVAVPESASAYTVYTFNDTCYAYDDAGGSKTYVGELRGEIHAANNGSTATIAQATIPFQTRSWVVTSNRWNNATATSWINGYSGTYTVGQWMPLWNPEAWWSWNASLTRWGSWVVQGYAASRAGLKFRCTMVASP